MVMIETHEEIPVFNLLFLHTPRSFTDFLSDAERRNLD